MRRYDITRGLVTAFSAGVAGGLVWIASAYVGRDSVGRFWASLGIIAGAGIVMALSQLAGGWTKGSRLRFAPGFFVAAVVPVLVVVGWTALATQPLGGWEQGSFASWSRSAGILDVVTNLGVFDWVLAFGFGLVLALSLDTRVAPAPASVWHEELPEEHSLADEPLVRERTGFETGVPVGPTARGRGVEDTAETRIGGGPAASASRRPAG
jgi:hypothetical protein